MSSWIWIMALAWEFNRGQWWISKWWANYLRPLGICMPFLLFHLSFIKSITVLLHIQSRFHAAWHSLSARFRASPLWIAGNFLLANIKVILCGRTQIIGTILFVAKEGFDHYETTWKIFYVCVHTTGVLSLVHGVYTGGHGICDILYNRAQHIN